MGPAAPEWMGSCARLFGIQTWESCLLLCWIPVVTGFLPGKSLQYVWLIEKGFLRNTALIPGAQFSREACTDFGD